MNSVTLRVNGAEVTRAVVPRMHLADFVREELNLTGTHIGCEHGVCGACTMIVDGRPIRSCISFAIACAGADVRTIESFDGDPVMALLRDAFSRRHALQCGYCTPGMLATAYDVVTRLPDADEARIREELSGNLCRCTGYVGIVAAIRDVLDSGPHRSQIRVVAVRSVPTAIPVSRPARAVPEASEVLSTADAVAPPQRVEGVTLTRSIAVPVGVAQLWTTLQDVKTIARCLPGATVDAIGPDGTVAGVFEIAIGPMRARFRGTARVGYDNATRSGEVLGAGGDGTSRSRAEGAIRFVAKPVDEQNSRLDLDITYRLNGPLAQFGRPAVVADVVDRLLGAVAANLASVAVGGAVDAAPIGGFRLMLAAMIGMVRRTLSRS
jgi:aerobic carbon-monoxide dehydrogenase small subunit